VIVTTRAQRRQLERDNANLPVALTPIPRHEWPGTRTDDVRLRVWRSRNFLVQEFEAKAPALIRLSINRTTLFGDRWDDNITWDELQHIKAECGYHDCTAVEVFPPDRAVVNVANMRHLWVLAERMPFEWKGCS
jgi:hypothetical protein